MAFDSLKLHKTEELADGRQLYSYSTTDLAATYGAAGYFKPLQKVLPGDTIAVTVYDQLTNLKTAVPASRATRVVTVVAADNGLTTIAG